MAHTAMRPASFGRAAPLTSQNSLSSRSGRGGEICVWRRWISTTALRYPNSKRGRNILNHVEKRSFCDRPITVPVCARRVSSRNGELTKQLRLRVRSRGHRNDDRSHASSVATVSPEEFENRVKEGLDGSSDDGVWGHDARAERKEEGKMEIKNGDDTNRKRIEKERSRAWSGPSRAISGLGVPLCNMVKRGEELVEKQLEQTFSGTNLNLIGMFTPRTRGIILLNILTFLYGSNVSVIKIAGATMDPALFSVGRFAIASIVFTPFLKPCLTKKVLRRAGCELGLLASVGYLTQCVSLLTSDAARVSFISTFTVIVVPLLEGLSGAKISKITWFAAAAALAGVWLLESNGAPFQVGDIWSFISAVVFGVHIMRTEHHSTGLSVEDSLPVTALQLIVVTACSGIWFCASHFDVDSLSSVNVNDISWSYLWPKLVALPWFPMLYAGVLSTAFCLWTELVSMRDVNATEAAVIYTVEPLWGAAIAWVTLGERWGPNGWLGACFILGGSLAMQVFGRSDPNSPASENLQIVAPSTSDEKLVNRTDKTEKDLEISSRL